MTTLRDDYVLKLEDENDYLRRRVRELERKIGLAACSLVPKPSRFLPSTAESRAIAEKMLADANLQASGEAA